MLYYILQIIACQVLFLLVYDLFLKRETFFNYNRAYLLITALLSFVLPFIKIDNLKNLAPDNFIVNLPELIIGNINQDVTVNKVLAEQAKIGVNETNTSIWLYVLLLGMFIMVVVFMNKLIKIINLKLKNPQQWSGNVLIVRILKSNMAFSFFNTIFLGEKISEEQEKTILKHELVHVNQYHSVDLLFFEITKILLWFNPLIYMYKNRIEALHEYIADKTTVKQNGKNNYYKQLLNQVFETNNVSFTNSFFKKSLIKKRIIMLQKSKSKKVNVLKYALSIPLIFGMLFYVSCEKEVVNTDQTTSEIDLNQFSYELQIGSKTMTADVEAVHKKHESFLSSNKDYVSWAEVDIEQQVISYSVHLKSEKVLDKYIELNVNTKDGKSYLMYMNLTSQNQEKTKSPKILNPRDYDGKSDVPFLAIDKSPTLESCKTISSQEEQKKCVQQTIAKSVSINFNIGLAETLELPDGVQKIYTIFKINKEGNVIDIKARAPHPDLETEAKRVIGQLPKFIPGEHNGEKVNVQYSLPISFQINP